MRTFDPTDEVPEMDDREGYSWVHSDEAYRTHKAWRARVLCEMARDFFTGGKSRRMDQKINCKSHGELPWNGDVICDGCGRRFQMRDDSAPNAAPDICPCGAKLLPSDGDDDNFTARPVCGSCAVPQGGA